MKQYTVGFIFTEDLSKVLLMLKNRPDFQVGKLNGVGGKVEDGETPELCFIREVKEETDIDLSEETLYNLGFFKGDFGTIHIITCTYSGHMDNAKSMTDEKTEWFDVSALPDNIMHNLSWFIPMCLDTIKTGWLQHVEIEF